MQEGQKVIKDCTKVEKASHERISIKKHKTNNKKKINK